MQELLGQSSDLYKGMAADSREYSKQFEGMSRQVQESTEMVRRSSEILDRAFKLIDEKKAAKEEGDSGEQSSG